MENWFNKDCRKENLSNIKFLLPSYLRKPQYKGRETNQLLTNFQFVGNQGKHVNHDLVIIYEIWQMRAS